MGGSAFEKCCWRCGRWGIRQYIESGRSDNIGNWECSNDRSCRRRREAAAAGERAATGARKHDGGRDG